MSLKSQDILDGYKRLIRFVVNNTEKEFMSATRMVESYYKKLTTTKDATEKQIEKWEINLNNNLKTMADSVYFYTTDTYEEYAMWVDAYVYPSKQIKKLREYAKGVLSPKIWEEIEMEVFQDEE